MEKLVSSQIDFSYNFFVTKYILFQIILKLGLVKEFSFARVESKFEFYQKYIYLVLDRTSNRIISGRSNQLKILKITKQASIQQNIKIRKLIRYLNKYYD
jgi:hypothetical protein